MSTEVDSEHSSNDSLSSCKFEAGPVAHDQNSASGSTNCVNVPTTMATWQAADEGTNRLEPVDTGHKFTLLTASNALTIVIVIQFVTKKDQKGLNLVTLL